MSLQVAGAAVDSRCLQLPEPVLLQTGPACSTCRLMLHWHPELPHTLCCVCGACCAGLAVLKEFEDSLARCTSIYVEEQLQRTVPNLVGWGQPGVRWGASGPGWGAGRPRWSW